ncbi:glycoside hydrolase domain-containing protein [Miniphocaeibacter massiliensis]|uniref:glycoside hydrolase domain-containing protein n=1 Tax=Miniphocaeibacter massiliensis TaxID=2041841 RepID=UPI000C1B8F07|nr:glycoside hydrolase domain-containing protein [Miniphocaeibacter massiliensis]
MDEMVLETQQWLNKTYGGDSRYKKVSEDGFTGWNTINTLIIALQIELGIAQTAANFGTGTKNKFKEKYPNGIKEQSSTDKTTNNVYSIIQGALWCKGYSTGSHITGDFYSGTGNAIKELKSDMGLSGDSTVTLEIMEALLSMNQFVLLTRYGGKPAIRDLQQTINRNYKNYTGIIPCDGLYGREMNKALIKVLQKIEGFSPSEATGNFGTGTTSKLVTISSSNASSYSEWVWLAQTALICNGYDVSPSSTWSSSLAININDFQKDYGLPQTGILDKTTWMSLFISKGDPNRKADACDTRFEITDELLSKLKADGYKIVGRYLTGGSFKEIRDGELNRIVKGGLKYFPIFQESARELSDFSYAKGKEHAIKATEAAVRLDIPETTIYFAVDMDIMDVQVDSHIIPYFRGINDYISDTYNVGIYASRNVCTRVAKEGLSVSSFVSDMSTGFSGNLGFPIPNNWNYDQFHEIKGYGGKWDLDKVAYSGRIPACDTVGKYDINYEIPPKPDTSGVSKTIFDAISLIEELELAYKEYKEGDYLEHHVAKEFPPKDIKLGVLNYLSKDYLKDVKFELSVEPFDIIFDSFMNDRKKELVNKLEPFIGAKRNDVKDNIGGLNDVAHLALTTLAYSIASPAPDFWTGWGGDLATGMSDVHNYMKKYPNLDLQRVANSLIGAHPSKLSPYFEKNGANFELKIRCNYTDLCDDGDAIALSKLLDGKNSAHTLSSVMREYYNTVSESKRYSQYKYDGLDFSNINKLDEDILVKMTGFLEGIYKFGLLELAGDSTEEEQIAACNAFANYLYIKAI